MEWLNYHHLLYFWVVAREGSIARACKVLRLAQPTISGQLHQLEHVLGEKLFARQGRGLVLTDVGRTVLRYADEIFALGRELQDVLKGRPTGRPMRLVVGIADVIPKLVAHRLLEPALKLPAPLRIVCREDRPEPLLAQLATHALDIVLSDAPAPPHVKLRAFNHLLGESTVTLFAAPALAQRLRRGFPGSLDGAPFLMPGEGTALRRALEQWFDAVGVRPSVAGDFDDSALAEVFGQAGAGVFAAPSVVAASVKQQYEVRAIGEVPAVRERYYAISVERKLKHPAVVAISESARVELFAEGSRPGR